MQDIYSVAQIRALENLAIKQGISSVEMMQRAAQAVLNIIKTRWPQAISLAIFCGTGNNGGDGYTLAHIAAKNGFEVSTYQIGEMEKFSEETRNAYLKCKELNIAINYFNNQRNIKADIFVDALLGIGLHGAIKENFKTAINYLNQLSPILALDIPSGINADNGTVLDVAVKADCTITFIGIKQGLLTGEAVDYVGEVICDKLALPSIGFNSLSANIQQITLSDFKKYLIPRKRSAHKGKFGHVLIVGGSPGFSGAVQLAAIAAARIGAGLVSIATHPQHAVFSNSLQPELMCHAINNNDELLNLIQHATVIAVGPGLGQSAWSNQLWQAALASDLPLVVDADALNLLAKNPQKRDNWVLTPHPGEAARLLRNTVKEIQANRFAAVTEIQHRYGGVCVLKGAGTLIANKDDSIKICTAGNPGMATGGMGDVLTGVIAGLIGQQLPLSMAADLGVVLHATAGDLAAKKGEKGLLASDLFPYLRKLVNFLPRA